MSEAQAVKGNATKRRLSGSVERDPSTDAENRVHAETRVHAENPKHAQQAPSQEQTKQRNLKKRASIETAAALQLDHLVQQQFAKPSRRSSLLAAVEDAVLQMKLLCERRMEAFGHMNTEQQIAVSKLQDVRRKLMERCKSMPAGFALLDTKKDNNLDWYEWQMKMSKVFEVSQIDAERMFKLLAFEEADTFLHQQVVSWSR